MNNKSFWKKKWFWVGIIIVSIIAGYLALKNEENPTYELFKVSTGDIQQIVGVSGTVEADPRINLTFQIPGKIAGIYTEVGKRVESGALLAELENVAQQIAVNNAKAVLDAAQATLDQRLAGATAEDIRVSATQVAQAVSDLNLTKTELDNTKRICTENIIQSNIQKEISENQLRQIEIELENVVLNDAQNIKIAESALETAKLNLAKSKIDLSSTTVITDKSITDAEANLRTAITESSIKIQKGLQEADKILGIDIPSANDDFEALLGARNRSIKPLAVFDYKSVKIGVDVINDWLLDEDSLSLTQAYDQVNTTIKRTDTLLKRVNSLLDSTITGNNFTLTELNSIKASASAINTEVNASVTALNLAYQTLTSAKLQLDTTDQSALASFQIFETALVEAERNLMKVETQSETNERAMAEKVREKELLLEQAEQNLELTKTSSRNQINTVTAQVDLKKSYLSNAKANLSRTKASPRSVDLDPLRAQVDQARASLAAAEYNYSKTRIIAPVTGVVSKVNLELAEVFVTTTSSLQSAIELISNTVKVEANVSETDIAKIKLGDQVTMTLDAFSRDDKFFGQIIHIDPAETIISGVVYYNIKIAFELPYGDIKPGMTANLDVLTAEEENTIKIPLRYIIFEKDGEFVEILKKDEIERRKIKLGIESDTEIEILEGLVRGDEIIIPNI